MAGRKMGGGDGGEGGVNISRLMERAEELRRALRESGEGATRGGGRDELKGTGNAGRRRNGTERSATEFVQRLLERVDGKAVSYESRLEHKRDQCRNGIVGHLRGGQEPPHKVSSVGLRGELHPEGGLAELGPMQHFAACSSLMRTLDSGIGTFPPPDYGGVPTKGAPKARGVAAPPAPPASIPGPPPGTKVPRKARTLDRELPGGGETGGKRRPGPTAPHSGGSAALRGGAQADAAKPRRAQSKNWTFPNARGCGGQDPFSAGGLAPVCSPPPRRAGPPPPPAAAPPPLSSGGGVGGVGGCRDPPAMEHSESLSDSLYDSLSSCGSQG